MQSREQFAQVGNADSLVFRTASIKFFGGSAFVITVLAMICLATSFRLSAQTVSGNILGQVQDQTGAAIGKAEVSAKNVDTGVVRQVTAEENGTYRISSVSAGPYEVTTTATGFQKEVRTGVVVTVGGDTSVNFSLPLGTTTEQIQVSSEAPQVDVSTSTIASFVNSAQIRELPLNGRDWLQLALLQPGVSLNTGQLQTGATRPQRGNGIALAISGGRPTDNAFRIDGLIVNDYANAGPGSTLGVNLGVDAIQEFSILTTNYSAEYGRGSGGIVNAITKSGANGLHGSAYYFVRNSAFDARNFFDARNIPPFRRNQYGGALGGRIKKDKTFFFTNYEKLGELRSLTSSVTTISANARNGILCANPACSQTTQVDINPKVLPYLALYPNPNGAVTGNTGLFGYPAPQRGQEHYIMGKIDHNFSASTTLMGAYTLDDTASTVPDNFNLKVSKNPARRQNLVINLQHLFSATLINSTRVGFSRTYAGGSIDGPLLNPILADPSLAFLPNQNLGSFTITGVTGVFGGIGGGFSGNPSQIFGYTTPQLYDDVSLTKGRHSIRTGFGIERILYNENSGAKPNGIWTFTSVENFLKGIPSQFTGDIPGTNSIRGARMSIVGGYIQDDYRIRPNFTLNLGLRYEMGTPVTEVNGKIPNLRNLTDPQVTTGAPYYNNSTKRNFAPRIGFAWSPSSNGRTSVRGGFGIFDIIPLPYLFVNRLTQSTPFSLTGVVNNPPPASFPNQVAPLLGVSSVIASHVEFNPRRTYKPQWNFSIQRELTKSMAMTLAYVGSAGIHLAHPLDDADQVPASLVSWNGSNLVFPIPAAGTPVQRINPNFGRIVSTEWSGHSSYHALQVNLVQRPVRGLNYQIAYTWSKSIDNGSNTFNDNESANTAGPPWAFCTRCNRGVSDYDTPHKVVANFLYDLPIPGSWKSNRAAKTVVGGWQIGGIYTRQSGGPFTLKIGSDRANTGNSQAPTVRGAQRPNYVNAPGCSLNPTTGDVNNFIMTQCFAWPAAGQLGNLGRNTLRMKAFRDLDLSLYKNQNLWGEKLKAQFRAEVFNVMNNTNLQAQLLTIFDGNGNLVPSVVTATGSTANTSRQLQFGLRLIF